MYYNTQTVPRVRGLKGSDRARAQNLDIAGPYKPIGEQKLFGGGSTSAAAAAAVVAAGLCGILRETGFSAGGSNGTGNDMSPDSLNPCNPDGPPPYRPPICTKCTDCPPPGPPGGGSPSVGSKSGSGCGGK